MIPAYTGAQIRGAERPLIEAGQGPALMRAAAHALANQAVLELRDLYGRVYGSHVLGLIGPGNNGADTLFALAALAPRGAKTTAVITGSTVHPEAIAAFTRAGGRTAGIDELPELLLRADLLLDGVLGIGANRPVQLPAIPADLRVVACDLPSGIDADTGVGRGSVPGAHATVTFGALKTGLVVGDGHLASGKIRVADIGLGAHLPDPEAWVLEDSDIVQILHDGDAGWRSGAVHKYRRGVLGLVAGSAAYPGAALLCASAAVATGLGMLRTHVPDPVSAALLAIAPESVPLSAAELQQLGVRSRRNDKAASGRIGAWALGPGLDTASGNAVLESALASGLPAVIDAGALDAVTPGAGDGHWILTPHAGELSTLLARIGLHIGAAEISADPLRWARWAAVSYDSVVLLKGPATVCAAPDGYTLVSRAAGAELATAGSGDVLTGLLGSLLAATAERPDAHTLVRLGAAAAYIHGRAGSLAAAGGPFGAATLVQTLPLALRELGA